MQIRYNSHRFIHSFIGIEGEYQMKNGKRPIVVTIVLLLTLGLGNASFAASQFTDVKPGDAHYDGIQWLAKQGIKGYDDNTFGKHKRLTREHAAIMFVKALDLSKPPKEEVEKYFTDVKAAYRYADYIAAAGKAGIFKGNEGKFLPQEELTRQQMATTLVNAYDLEANSANVSINLKNVSATHKDNVQILADLKITNQLDDFRPKEAITRAQFATFLYESDKVEIGDVSGPTKKYTTRTYDYNFSTMLDKQMKVKPQTDSAWTWYDASSSLTQYYLNPNNFKKNSGEYYQFLVLSDTSNVNDNQLNDRILKGKGVLEGKASEFKKASQTHNVNEIYLISHALLETGNGTSTLAKGVEVGKDKNGNPVRVTSSNRSKLTDIKKTYNFFGIGAVDSCPLTCGSERAYAEGWFTHEKAIVGGAQFIGRGYVNASQDTLYKMRWNPDAPATHQYATDAGWAVKQTSNIKKMYDLLEDDDGIVLNFEIPSYKKQPAAKSKPTGANVFNVDKNHPNAGKEGFVTASALNFRKGPTTNFSVIKALSQGTQVTIIGENTGWYKVKVDKQEGWVSSSYIKVNGTKSVQGASASTYSKPPVVTPEEEELLTKQAQQERVIGIVTADDVALKADTTEESDTLNDHVANKATVEIIGEKDGWFNVIIDDQDGWIMSDSIDITNVTLVKSETEIKDEPNGDAIVELLENETVVIIPDNDLNLTKDGEWYKVYYHGQEGWVHEKQMK